MTVGDAAVLSVVLSGGGMLLRAIKATIKNDFPCGGGISTIGDGSPMVFACAALNAGWGLIR
jgi:hypothetical protein